MSLLVWLPLNGNLDNKGACETTTAVTSTPVWATTGKISSQSLYTKTRQTTMYFPQLVGTTTYSVAYWLYIPSATAPTAWVDMFGIGFVCGSNTYYERDERREANTAGLHAYHMAKDTTAGSTTNGYWGLGNRSAAKDTWAHYVLTKDDTSAKLYENGVLVTTVANSNFENTPRTMTGNIYLGDNGCEAYLNDFRIYNHCLSAAEVHEISQGLVLHYKLDKVPTTVTNAYSTPYFDTNAAAGGWNHWGRSGASGSFAINTDKQYMYYKDKDRNHAVSNETDATGEYLVYQSPAFDGGYRSLQCIVKETNSTPITESILFPAWNNRDGGAPSNKWTRVISLGNGFYLCQVDGVHQDGNNDLIGFYVCPGYTIYFSAAWCENDREVCSDILFSTNIIQDSSGYGYNGIIVGNPTLTANSPRYNTCMEFNGTDAAVNCGHAFNIQQAQACTWTGWFYLDSWRTSGWQYLFSSQEGGGILLGKYDTCTVRARAHVYTAADLSTSAYSADANYAATETEIGDTSGWHMITGVYTPSAIKLYIDGVLKKTTTTTNYGIHFNTSANMYVAAESAGTTPNPVTKCKVSDIRIYYTALSDSDIKALYAVGAKIDNKGNIHTYEYLEDTKESISKSGTISAHQCSEFFPNLHYDKIIYKEPDGSLWIHIAHHNNPGIVRFASTDNFATGVYVNENCWYDIEQNAINLSAYEFMVQQALTTGATNTKYRWIQSVSPVGAVYDDVKPAAVTRITTGGYTDGTFGGIFIGGHTSTRARIANASSGNWYGSFGSWTLYQNGTPGYPNTVVTTGYMDLYLRIDNLDLNMGAKILKNSGINANTLIEF